MTEHVRGKLRPHPSHANRGKSHLEFYERESINPVRYKTDGHFERMEALLRQLRVLPAYFENRSVLEIAAGSGQTLQYIDTLSPTSICAIEPNASGFADINALGLNIKALNLKLEDFNPWSKFDIVICQNWLGVNERHLLKKLASFVAPNGILLTTCISPTGLTANGLRREMADRLVQAGMTYSERINLLTAAFGSHLATLPDMTRSHEDWIADNMVNPAWHGIGLTLPMIVEEIGSEFDILGTSPSFIEDWRWFKAAGGDYNLLAIEQMAHKDPWFLDYRIYQDSQVKPAILALREAYDMLARPSFTASDVANMGEFKGLFGRETVHVSLVKR